MLIDKRIPSSELKVGDVIGIRESVSLGWKSFRYPITRKKVIKRITPKRTKIITEDGCEYNARNTWFFAIDEETIQQNNVALSARKINNVLYELDRMKSNNKLFSASDDKIVAISELLEKVKQLLNDNP